MAKNKEDKGVVMWVLGFVVAILWANVLEWSIHRFVLHDLGRKRGNFWRFHWSDHHSAARRNGFEDPDYAVTPFQWNAQGKEVVSLGFLFCLSLPFVWVSWGFVIGSWVSIANYYFLHRWAHLRPAWCRRWMPWHYDHHMAPNQDMNWCVTWPLMDHLMGTRLVWVGTDKEAEQWAKIRARKEDYRLRRDSPISPSNAATNPKSRGVWC